MAEQEAVEPKKKKPSIEIRELPPNAAHPGRIFKAQRGKIIAYFTVSTDYKVTLLTAKDGTPKDFHFELSDPFVIANVTKVINTIGWYVVDLKKKAEDGNKS